MAGPNNWSGLLDALMGEWNKTKQPLKERATMLPLGQYEDGSIGMAWPGFLADPIQRSYGAANTPIPPVNDDEAWANKSTAFFDAASLAPLGGALGAVDNAVGSAGGKLMRGAADLPMDQASRMARAREMGFDPKRPLYHGTQAQFDEFDPNFIGGNYGGDKLPSGFDMTPNRKLAEWHAEGGNVMELMTKDDVAPWLDATDTFFDFQPDEVKAAIKALGIDVPPNARTADILKQISDPDAARQAFMDNGVVGMLHGMDNGIAGDGLTYRVFDPKNIRSTQAAFDPAKSDSANLLAANAKEGALPGLLANALEQPQGIRADLTPWRALPETTRDDIAGYLMENVPAVADDVKGIPEYVQQMLDTVSDAGGPVGLRVQGQRLQDIQGYNRQPSEAAVNKYVDMLGQSEAPPILVDGDKFIDGGHRFAAYKNAGRETIPTVDIGPLLRADWTKFLDGDATLPYIYSNTPTGSLPGLAAQTQDGTDPQTITTANILKFLRGQ